MSCFDNTKSVSLPNRLYYTRFIDVNGAATITAAIATTTPTATATAMKPISSAKVHQERMVGTTHRCCRRRLPRRRAHRRCPLQPIVALMALTAASMVPASRAFVVAPLSSSTITSRRCSWRLSSSSSSFPDIDSMRAGEMRKELESYGISTKSMFERSEFAEALREARAQGKKPINGSGGGSGDKNSSSSSSSSTSEGVNGSTQVNGSSATKDGREERYQKAFEKGKTMKVSDLRNELKARGISTKSFFEKSEFVKAYADAVVADDAAAAAATGKAGGRASEEPPFDPSYRDVIMQKVDRRALVGQSVIDVRFR